MGSDADVGALDLSWDSVMRREDYQDDIVEVRDRLADAARDARWTDVFAILDGVDALRRDVVEVNSPRVGGRSRFAPLHQAAWHGADLDVVEELLRRGAWRTLRTTDGRTARQIAAERGHERLADAVAEPDIATRILDMETYLAALIAVRARPLDRPHRMPQLGPLVEQPRGSVWCAIPGMYGGFHYRWLEREVQDTLLVESWSRVVGGSGQRHHVSDDGVVLVEEGFV